MKYILLVFSFIFIVVSCHAQTTGRPDLWLRADSVSMSDSLWRDVSGNDLDANPHTSMLPPLSFGMNFNRCFEISPGDGFLIPFNDLTKSEAAAFIVYETTDSVEENGLWSLTLDTAGRIGLSSHRILNKHGSITYDTINRKNAVVNYLSQAWDNTDAFFSTDSESHSILSIGRADSMSFSGSISEFVFFNKHISDTSVMQWYSYLAVKYGITLFKSNYLDSKRRCIWNYDALPDYSLSIAGIGRDSVMGLSQKQTYFGSHHIVFGIGSLAENNELNTSTISDGDFILMGMDSSGISGMSSLYLSDGSEFAVTGKSIVQVTGTDPASYSTFLKLDFDMVGHAIPTIIIDRSGTGDYPLDAIEFVYPDDVDSMGNVFFYNLHWDTDGNGKDAFSIILESTDLLTDDIRSCAFDSNADEEKSSANSYRITPNPNNGEYEVEIVLSEISDVTVGISTSEGKLVRIFKGSGQAEYVFQDSRPSPGLYLIDIHSAIEHKVLKMIVQ